MRSPMKCFVALLLAISIGTLASASSMDCGDGVSLCGVLTLESGYGSGNYEHPEPVVHGLWPEVGNYGDSKCFEPEDVSDPTVLYPCYQQVGEDDDSLLSFETHEWDNHGMCSGAKDAEDYFTQVCKLSTQPLDVMNASRQDGGDLDAMADALTAAGYDVFSIDSSNSQVQLSACAMPGGTWALAAVKDFPTVCGGWMDDDEDDTPSDDSVDSCEPSTHGPKCSTDIDCVNVTNCLRCANSGYCTDVPLRKRFRF